jgi:hypothetical protein
MRRALLLLAALLAAAVSVHAQDAQKLLDTFKRNFAIASLDVKIQILQDAASGTAAPSMGPLFQQAVDFVVDNSSLVPTDARFNQLASIAAEQLGLVGYQSARSSVWKLFQAGVDSQTLAKAAVALGTIGAGDADTIANLNRYVDSQNTLFSAGTQPDTIVIAAAFQALGKLGDPSSFPYLFSAINRGYGEKLTAIAHDALLLLKGDFQAMLTGVLKERPLPEKKLALQMALDSDKLSDDAKAQTAEYALDMALHTSVADAALRSLQRDMRFQAAASLGAHAWAHATPLMIEHLDMTIGEFDKGLTDRNHLLDAIGGLGAMATHESAVRLTQFIVLINSYTEKGKAYDEAVVTAVLQNLGTLGDKVAFDDLMYTQYLTYSAGVKKAARTALDKLKW